MSPSRPLSPLLAKRVAPLTNERLDAFRQAGALASVDVHVVDHLAALVGESDPDVALALALAVRGPRHGHICINLASVDVEELLPDADDERDTAPTRTPLALPLEPGAWLSAVARSALVGGRGDLSRPFVLDGSLLYPTRYFAYQQRLAQSLRARMTRLELPADAALLRSGLRALFGSERDDDGKLNRQMLAAAMALLRGFTVISGGPGTGKTYTVRSVLTLLWAQWALAAPAMEGMAGPRTALAAPTGKAAARMKEALLAGLDDFVVRAKDALPQRASAAQLQAYLSSLDPGTVHRLLGWNPASPSRFRHDRQAPLPADIVVVDETSMVDFALMSKLVDAVAAGARLILLGDQHQLASVEAGTVLADLCGPTSVDAVTVSRGFATELADIAGMQETAGMARKVDEAGPHDAIVQLSRSRRFKPESGIGRFARACVAGRFDGAAAAKILTEGRADSDVTALPHGPKGSLPPAAEDIIVEGYLGYLERLLAGPGAHETLVQLHLDVLQRFDRFRLLCAHRGGRLGASALNRVVVELLGERKRVEQAEQRKRGARPRLAGFQPDGQFWVGRPVIIVRNDYVVRLFNGDVGIVVRDSQRELKVAFPDSSGVRYVAPARLPEHQTVFAMTIHKSQGSEFEHAMIVLPERMSPVLTRELIYTAVTRAKRRVTLVCDEMGEVLAEGLDATVRRASGLRAELWGKE